MNKKNFLLINFYKLTSIFAIFAMLISSASAKQQNVLLDENGNPLSDEILLLLSGSSNKSPSKEKISKKTKGDKKSGSSIKKKAIKYANNPLLEQELLEAMKAGKTVRVRQLIKARVRPTYKNYKGETPLGIAVSRGWASIVADLIAHGADVHEKGSQGLTLLHVAAANNLIDMAKLLVKNGIDPATKTKIGWTPLHVASRYGHWKLVNFFLKHGVDPNTKNKAGRTALDLAINLKHQGIIKILSRVTSEKSLNQIRMEKLRVVRMENHQKRLAKLEELKEFRRLKLGANTKNRKKGKKRRKSKKRVSGITDKEALILLGN
jgi:ankyrin repeat protein